MKHSHALLLLEEPSRGGGRFAEFLLRESALLQRNNGCTTLVFDESGRRFACAEAAAWTEGALLSQAQAALQRARERAEWLCVAASGTAMHIALALAAQLPVERVALWQDAERGAGREIARIAAFARRNLSLVAAEILLVDVPAAEARRLARQVSRHCEIRRTEGRLLRLEQMLGEWKLPKA